MSFEFHNGAIVSILISKDETKIRIVSNQLFEQWPIIKELVASLEAEHAPKDIEEILSFNSQLPFNEFNEALDQHFNLHKSTSEIRKQLEKRTI